MTTHPIRLYAHRGASKIRPENTLLAYRQGLDDGADVLELDVHLTKDRVLVVSHDPDGRRLGVNARIAAATLDEVRQWDAGAGFVDAEGNRPYLRKGLRIPLFEEVLAEFPGVPLNVDVKPNDNGVTDALLAILEKAKALDRVIVASFHGEVVAHARARIPGVRTCLSANDLRWLLFAPGFVRPLRRSEAHAAQVPPQTGPLRLDTKAFVDRAHAAGHRVDYWVVNDAAQARTLLALGADGIMSDDPAAIRDEIRAAKQARSGN